MSPRRRLLFIALIGLQLLSILGFAAYRETILRRGQEVVLQVLPVDPRDLFRGDFVVLRYEIATLRSADLCCISGLYTGSTVYVRLEPDPSGEKWAATAAAPEIDPGWTTYIKGKVVRAGRGPRGTDIGVEYGIESFFVPEGQGRTIEQAMRDSREVKAQVAVDGRGSSALKGLLIDGEPWQPE